MEELLIAVGFLVPPYVLLNIGLCVILRLLEAIQRGLNLWQGFLVEIVRIKNTGVEDAAIVVELVICEAGLEKSRNIITARVTVASGNG